MKIADSIFELADPVDWKRGLWVMLLASWVSMTALRSFINPVMVQFPSERWVGDFLMMCVMGILVISIDAVLIVVISWRHLRDKRDVNLVAGLVGLTHVFFPIGTFLITVLLAAGTERLGLSPVWAGGAQTAIFFAGFWCVFSHLRTVHREVREQKRQPRYLDPAGGWGPLLYAVLLVSIDALMVGPAKVAFMDRYEKAWFVASFFIIGAGVFMAVQGAGRVALWLKSRIEHEAALEKVYRLDWLGSVGQVFVFIHFSTFAGMYVLYSFVPRAFLIWTSTIWSLSILVFLIYLWVGKIEEIKAASRIRAGLAAVAAD